MFRRFAGIIPEGANGLFLQHPSVLVTLLEVAWQRRAHTPDQAVGSPFRRSNVAPLPDYWLEPLKDESGLEEPQIPFSSPLQLQPVLWDHLIYAYMIENTRIYEIFRRVLHEFLHGEKLGVPTEAAQHWLRNTEELFYRDPPTFSIAAVTSHIRPDLRATWRNAYHRMFGMDLNHGTDDGQPYPYVKADAYNNEFVTMFEELLREVWVAISNVANTTGANPTDPGKIENLVRNLHDMLISRRTAGNLSREEFSAVATMSWFHLTTQSNTPIVQSLRAEANSEEQRLFKIAQRVGLPAHGLSGSFFEIADPISRVLIQIEADRTGIVPGLLVAGPLQKAFNTIITHWSLITGRDMKAGKVTAR